MELRLTDDDGDEDNVDLGEMIFQVTGYDGGMIKVTADQNMTLIDLAKILHEFSVDLGQGLIQRYQKAKDN